MKAMILAAGRGERLRPLTDTMPKPLLKVAGKTLIEYHLTNLAAAGFNDIVINTAWLTEKIHQTLGDGSQYGVNIVYADEAEALETAGGIIHALPLLGKKPFLVVNGDIWSDFDFTSIQPLKTGMQADLVLVANPVFHPQGDFAINQGYLTNDFLENELSEHTSFDKQPEKKYTYSGIGVYSPQFFRDCKPGKLALATLLRKKADKKLIRAQLYSGQWTDVGTLARLQVLDKTLSEKSAINQEPVR